MADHIYPIMSVNSPSLPEYKLTIEFLSRLTNSITPQIDGRSTHVPGMSPLSAAHTTIALAYNKLGLSCAALKHYDSALKADPLNFDSYLGKGDFLTD